jgi:CrcB protein
MNSLSAMILVFLGGGTGAALRYLVGVAIKPSPSGFPLSTFVINVTGCFLIGLAASLFKPEQTALRNLLIVGFLGGFTTFSTFANESLQLFNIGASKTAVLYLILSNICGIIAVYSGARLFVLFN